MIYLRKNKNDEKFFDTDYRQILCIDMESFEDYFEKVKNFEKTEQDILFHLFQLIDIAINSQAINIWYRIQEKKVQISFMKRWDNKKLLSESLWFTKFYCSNQEYESYPESFRELINKDFNEAITDFAILNKPFIKQLKRTLRIIKADELQQLYISNLISQGLWSNLRIIPKQIIRFEVQGDSRGRWKFVGEDLYLLDKNLTNKLIQSKYVPDFFSAAAKECVSDYMRLADLYFKIKDKNSLLEKKVLIFINEKIKINFFNLLDNENYKKIYEISPQFLYVCHILLNNELLQYEQKNKTLQPCSKKWKIYYASSLLKDPELGLNINIKEPLKSLFGVSMKDRTTEETYSGYKNNISDVYFKNFLKNHNS